MKRYTCVVAFVMSVVSAFAQLPLPEVPASLTSPGERASYVVRHFWDAMKWNDPVMAADTVMMEHAFADYASVLPHVPADSLDNCVGVLLRQAAVNPEAYDRVLNLSEIYLYEPESPVYFPEGFRSVLIAAMDTACMPPLSTTRAVTFPYMFGELSKNRVGHQANDFSFKTRAGEEMSLLDAVKAHPMNLVMFYDPDCDHCRDVITELKRSPDVACMIAGGKLGMLAVYYEGDDEVWNHGKGLIPDSWIDAVTPDDVIEDEALYTLNRQPTLYLIDNEGKVLVRDGVAIDVLRYIMSRK